MQLVDLYYYAEDSPSGLRWRVDRFTGDRYQIKIASKDSIAGCLNCKTGYWEVYGVNSVKTKAHRVVWSLHYGVIENGMVIDHLDGDKVNNIISNLRLTSISINTRNRKMQVTNTTGVTGVYYFDNIRADNKRDYRWRATVSTSEGLKSKSFSCNKYGREEAFRLACEWRENKIKELNEQGAGYTERHGKD